MHLNQPVAMIENETVFFARICFHPQHISSFVLVCSNINICTTPNHSSCKCQNYLIHILSMMVSSTHYAFKITFHQAYVFYL